MSHMLAAKHWTVAAGAVLHVVPATTFYHAFVTA